jgi:hypothetical protein
LPDINQPITTIIPDFIPDGNNNWYKTNTAITFQVLEETDIAKIFYKWDQTSTWKEFKFLTNSETLTIVVAGGETTTTLENYPILQGSLVLKQNGTPLVQNTDFSINTETGIIDFTATIVQDDVVKADYSYFLPVDDEVLLKNAVGGETTLTLAHSHIVENSIELKKNVGVNIRT